MRWHNWSGGQTAEPFRLEQPETEADVIALVQRAAEEGRRVKAVGAGHSFTPVAVTDGVLVNLDNLSGVVNVDRGSMEVTFLAGTRLRYVPALLRPHGLALANQGDVDPQSIAGAVSTGTHGTGIGLTGFAGMVRGLRTITADGRVHDTGPGDPLFDYGRVSIGALGIVTRITMSVVDTFALAAVEKAEALEPVYTDFPARARAVDHLEYYWFPGTDVAHVKTNTRHRIDELDSGPDPRVVDTQPPAVSWG
ncbi:MAG: FAD-binding protein, partial [Corynebacterium sp.]|nr:FAD-binding protein [Corynebacterium sp.]